MKKLMATTAVLALAVLLAWPVFGPLLGPLFGAGDKRASAGQPAARQPVVRTLRLEPQPFESRLSFNGTLMADSSIEIKSELRGKVVGIHFDDGESVAAGDLIVSIDADELRAELESVREQLALAELTADRLQNLFQRGSVTASERDDAVSQREVLRAEERRLSSRLAKMRIEAPFAGTLGLREISLGDLIETDTLITTLQTVANLRVDFSVPERYKALFEPGLELSLFAAGYAEPFSAVVRAISPRVDVATRTITVRADVSNPERKLLPGNYARVELVTRTDAALLVPTIAVLQSLESVSVFTVEEGVAVRREVQTGHRSNAQIEILRGLDIGDEVITSGIQSVRDGQPVRVQNTADLS
jgi:membrane fusion protein (multidrug efflux system)